MKNISFSDIFLWFGIGALLFMAGEIFLGKTIYLLTGYSMWQYQFFPSHDSFSHTYAWIQWGFYGVYAYLIGLFFTKLGLYSKIRQGWTTSIDGVLMEIYINLIFLWFFKKYLFYYSPPELLHLSSLWVLPFYFIVGLVIYKFKKVFENIDAKTKIQLGLYFIVLSIAISF